MRKRKDETEQTADGNRRRHLKKNLNLSDAATCVLHTDASGIRSGDVRRLDNYFLNGDRLSIWASVKV